jgi:hypothetical protein
MQNTNFEKALKITPPIALAIIAICFIKIAFLKASDTVSESFSIDDQVEVVLDNGSAALNGVIKTINSDYITIDQEGVRYVVPRQRILLIGKKTGE